MGASMGTDILIGVIDRGVCFSRVLALQYVATTAFLASSSIPFFCLRSRSSDQSRGECAGYLTCSCDRPVVLPDDSTYWDAMVRCGISCGLGLGTNFFLWHSR